MVPELKSYSQINVATMTFSMGDVSIELVSILKCFFIEHC